MLSSSFYYYIAYLEICCSFSVVLSLLVFLGVLLVFLGVLLVFLGVLLVFLGVVVVGLRGHGPPPVGGPLPGGSLTPPGTLVS